MPKDVTLDPDIMRLIDHNRIFPGDTSLMVLRRLLKIDKLPSGWFSQGVFLPNGTKIRMGYGDDPSLSGKIEGGRWVIRGRKFDSPSTAATAFVQNGKGRKRARVNGWLYWQVCIPGRDSWALLDSLRIGNPVGLASSHNVVAGPGRGKVAPFRSAHP